MRASDPFSAGPDVSAYVPRPEFEQNCLYLASKLQAGPTWVGNAGPAGVGKTLLLRLLLRRLAAQFTPVYVPSGELPPAQVLRWVAAQVAAPGESDVAVARRLAREGRPLLLAIDEAQLGSAELVAWIEHLCSSASAARAVLAWTELEGGGMPGALARCPTRVFVEPLQLAEVAGYVEAQLARAGAAPEQRAVLAGPTLGRIALASDGNPRIIQRLADAELAAHAWRTRVPTVRQRAACVERATASAPRGASGIAAPATRLGLGRCWLVVIGATVLVALVGVALGLAR